MKSTKQATRAKVSFKQKRKKEGREEPPHMHRGGQRDYHFYSFKKVIKLGGINYPIISSLLCTNTC